MSLSTNDFSKYTNDIQVHKVKKSNLPSKVTGKHMYFIDNEDGTYSVGVSASDGTIKICSDNTDKLQEQINVLEDSPNFTGSPKIQGQQIAVKDTIVEIWSGNIVNGTITLSEKITNFNRIDLHTQPAGGYGYTAYSFDRGQHGWKLQTNTKYAIPIATGKGLDIVFSDDGMSATVSNNTGILRRIFAFKKG
jgi:hypothetical protein